jgi:tetratricopeptide (TPR) repeat protein
MSLFSKSGPPDASDLLRRGEFRQAAKAYEMKIRRNPSDLNAKLRLAEAYEGMGEADRASAIYVDEADSRFAGGDRTAGVAFLRKALGVRPDDQAMRDRLEDVENVGGSAERPAEAFSFDLDADTAAGVVAPAWPGAGESEDGMRIRNASETGAFLHSVFPALDEGGLHALLSQVRARRLETGEVLLREGDAGTSLFIVETGLLEVRSFLGREERILARLAPGEVIGEVALLRGVSRTATVKALEPSSVLELALDKTEAAASLGEGWAARLENILSERLEGTLALLKENGKRQDGYKEG